MAVIILADDGISFDGQTPEKGPLGGAESSPRLAQLRRHRDCAGPAQPHGDAVLRRRAPASANYSRTKAKSVPASRCRDSALPRAARGKVSFVCSWLPQESVLSYGT